MFLYGHPLIQNQPHPSGLPTGCPLNPAPWLSGQHFNVFFLLFELVPGLPGPYNSDAFQPVFIFLSLLLREQLKQEGC